LARLRVSTLVQIAAMATVETARTAMAGIVHNFFVGALAFVAFQPRVPELVRFGNRYAVPD
jgi:hypothetical protein